MTTITTTTINDDIVKKEPTHNVFVLFCNCGHFDIKITKRLSEKVSSEIKYDMKKKKKIKFAQHCASCDKYKKFVIFLIKRISCKINEMKQTKELIIGQISMKMLGIDLSTVI